MQYGSQFLGMCSKNLKNEKHITNEKLIWKKNIEIIKNITLKCSD